MARYGVIHANLLFEIMVSSYCIVFRGVPKCKTVTALNINHGLYFSNPGSYKPGLVHCSKTQTKPYQNRGSDQVYTDQVFLIALYVDKGENIAGKPDGPNVIIVGPPNSQNVNLFTLWSTYKTDC